MAEELQITHVALLIGYSGEFICGTSTGMSQNIR